MIVLMKNKRLIIIVSVAVGLLLVPCIAMLFDLGVQWKPSDFFLAAAFLLGIGLTVELVMRKVKKKSHRIILTLVVIVILFLIWAELAVGIFNTSLGGN